jgi:hypothetical protein
VFQFAQAFFLGGQFDFQWAIFLKENKNYLKITILTVISKIVNLNTFINIISENKLIMQKNLLTRHELTDFL